MCCPRAILFVAVIGGAPASACHRSLDSSDSQTASKDADTNPDVEGPRTDGGDPDSHATDASPLDGGDAASTRTQFTSWTSCGWSGGTCLCDGIRACQAVAGGSLSALGSQQARVCASDDGVCEYVVFVETEGGGTARRCRVSIDAGSCLAGFASATDSHCVDLFTCNLLMGTCPPDIMPGSSVISCR